MDAVASTAMIRRAGLPSGTTIADEDYGGMLMPLAACGCAPVRGFRCEAIF
ncbi:hypothetical protein [Methylobacterium komagatae]